ncbi:MAG TPA: metalloregulator ArsR/SmtB family transcription factor [Methylocystis sp.]|nr:metalloregulator ArsR/SmtB family transcription factor [Methylocystis sp.]
MTKLHLSRERAAEAAERLKVYAQPQRLMILSSLAERERTVGEIEAATLVAQPALSQQLAELRRAGLVETRRAAKQVFYRLAGRDVLLCVQGIEAMVGGEGDLARALADIAAQLGETTWPDRERSGAASFAKLL